jgi:hypothetical protein
MEEKMTNIERKTLTEGTVYDLSDLQYLGWTDGDGTDRSGYNCWEFFAPGGAYLGPDEHGIEPIFAVTTEDDHCAVAGCAGYRANVREDGTRDPNGPRRCSYHEDRP